LIEQGQEEPNRPYESRYVCTECPNKTCYVEYPFNQKKYPTCPRMRGAVYKFRIVNNDTETVK